MSLSLLTQHSLAESAPAQEAAPTGAQPAQAESSEASGSPAPQAEEAARALVEPRQSLLDALGAELPAAQQLWLTVGEERFLALYQPNNRPQPMGAVLLVHDVGQHADWPDVVRPLRRQLPDYGWHTLAINLPGAPDLVPPPRVFPDKAALYEGGDAPESEPAATEPQPAESVKEGAGSAEGAETPTIQVDKEAQSAPREEPDALYQQRVIARIGAGVEHLRQQGVGNIVVVGVGENARLATRYLAANPDLREAKGMTLVWVAPRLQPEERSDFKVLFGDPPYPRMLDVADGADLARREDARERYRSARRIRMPHYVQVQLPLHYGSGAGSNDVLVQRLRGWLEVNAPGEERKNSAGPVGP